MNVVNFSFKISISLCLFLSVCLISCQNDIAVVNSITSDLEKKLPIESGTNVEIIYSDSAIVRAKLSTPKLDRYTGKKPFMEMPKGMKVLFFDENHAQQSTLTANYGIGFDSGNGMERMEAKNNVVVVNAKGEQLNTEHLIWDAVSKRIYTDKFVKITTKDEIIWGDGLESNQDFSRYEIKNVKGQIDVKDPEPDNKK